MGLAIGEGRLVARGRPDASVWLPEAILCGRARHVRQRAGAARFGQMN
jgi:hypothetical protein